MVKINKHNDSGGEHMATESATRRTMPGTCNFCKEEFDKRSMTQHLKRCKQRAAAIAAEDEKKRKVKIRLLHLIVEGLYNPQYWMHLEISATEPLETLDSFLRDTWLECCGHLSAFKIGDVSYESAPEDFSPWDASPEPSILDELIVSDEELGIMGDEVDGNKLIQNLAPADLEQAPESMLAEFRKIWQIDDLIAYLRTKLKEMPPFHSEENMQRILKEYGSGQVQAEYILEEQRKYYLYKGILESFLDMVEDRTMGALLGRVLKVGQKFEHEYDFGSTTHLKLRVLAERQGIAPGKRKPVTILARNNPPVILCQICGKRATYVASGYYSAEEDGYCSKCAKECGDEDMLLPVVNSPRVGVCGYEG
jgi:hypothetical protein